MHVQKQMKKVYTLEFLSNLSIHDAVSIVLLVVRGFTLLDFGVAEGVFHITSFLCEVPSGMFADIFGRKKVLALGQFFFCASAVTMVFSRTLVGICLSYAFTALGYNMSSGTKEALVFDSLQQAGIEEKYLKTNSNLQIFYQVAIAVSSLCAGLALEIGFVICYLIKAWLSFSCIFVALSLKEPGVSANRIQKFSLRSMGRELKKQAVESFKFLRNIPRAAKIMFAAGIVACVRVLVTFYVQELLSVCGASGTAIGIATICISLGAMAGAKLSGFFQKKFTLATTAVLTTLLVAFGIGISATTDAIVIIILGTMIASLSEMVLYLTTDTALNNMFSSDKRATLISTNSMVFSLYMLPLSPLSGYIAHNFGLSTTFFVFSGLLIFVAFGIYFLHGHQKRKKGLYKPQR